MERVQVGINFVGEWWDEFYEMQGGVLVKVHETKPRFNTQMDAFAQLLVPALCANEASLFGGFLFHAQGNGDVGWGVSPPSVNPADTTLFAETLRKTPDSIVFLDGADLPTASLTNKVRVQTTYGLAEMAGETIREQAVFGGTATATADSGMVVNVIRHEGIFKSGAVQLIRSIKFTFS